MDNTNQPPKNDLIDLASIRARLSKEQGKVYWQSLEAISGNPQFEELAKQEFPDNTEVWIDPFSRRKFMKIMAASLAFAGAAACKLPTERLIPNEKIIPYVKPPEEIVYGKPLFFATVIPFAGSATGVLVESHMGRPTKIEGNPDHPASLGASDVLGQASILNLYDPDRAQTCSYLREGKSWGAFVGALSEALEARRQKGGEGLRILTRATSSPTLASQMKSILAAFPKAKWHQYEPAISDSTRAGAQLAYGEPVNTIYNLAKANVVVSIGSDFLAQGPAALRYAREFGQRRRNSAEKVLRMYTVESTPTNTGSSSDHRLPLKPSEVAGFAQALASALGVAGVSNSGADNAAYKNWVSALTKELQENKGTSLVVAGSGQPAIVHALAHAMNQTLGNVGNTVSYTDSPEYHPDGFTGYTDSLKELVKDMEAGAVDMLVIVSGNPVYDAPVDLNFAQAMSKVALRIHYSSYYEETSELCHWHVPESHYLESWSDARTFDGTASIVQPLIAPLYPTKSIHEFFAAFTDQKDRTSYEIVRSYWQTQFANDFENVWRKSLHDGVIAGTAYASKTVSLKADAFASASLPKSTGVEIVFAPDPTVYDGRFSNNGWLQELPKPLTKITWDNAVIMGPAMAQRLGVTRTYGNSGGEHGRSYVDMVEIKYQGRTLKAATWILPGHPSDCVTLHLGYGRKKAGRVGNGTGFNAYSLRTSGEPWSGGEVQVVKVNETFEIACPQGQEVLHGREHDILRSSTYEAYKSGKSEEGKESKGHHEEKKEAEESVEHLSMYPEDEHKYPGYAWGMSIDVGNCIGCNACVMACQSENNIPVIGKDQVLRGRHMHWLRIDRYYTDNGHDEPLDNPEAYFQPVPCMQCENAPCEVVCPVNATNHSAEGLNDMVYNRCVGTRYCSNNCPYKVRRFNFLQYADFTTGSLKLLNNPDVTVRSRGVMEKCTYCVQRINYARVEAEKENRSVKDGEILTACQSVCPTEAIVFGNINDKESKVSKLKAEQRNYSMVEDLNTKPRTTYLAALRNPNPELNKKG